VDSGCHDDLRLSNLGGAIFGEQVSDCVIGVVDLNNGSFNNTSPLLSNGGRQLRAPSVSTCIASNAGTDKTASSVFTVPALVEIKWDEVYVVSLGGGSLDKL
jgi:hypothetical protein